MELKYVVEGKTYHWDGTDGCGHTLSDPCYAIAMSISEDDGDVQIDDTKGESWYVYPYTLSEIEQ